MKKITSESEPVVKILKIRTARSQLCFNFGGISGGFLELEGVFIPATVVKDEEMGLVVQGHACYGRGFRMDAEVDPDMQYPQEVFYVPLINISKWVGADDPQHIHLIVMVIETVWNEPSTYN